MLIIRRTRHKLSYKKRRFGLTSLEKMTMKSVGEHVDILCNISNLAGTTKFDKLIKGLCNVYMDIIIADDSCPRTRVSKPSFFTFEMVDPDTSYIYYTFLKEDLPRLHTALGLDALGGSVRLENGMKFGTEEALLILLYKFTYSAGSKVWTGSNIYWQSIQLDEQVHSRTSWSPGHEQSRILEALSGRIL